MTPLFSGYRQPRSSFSRLEKILSIVAGVLLLIGLGGLLYQKQKRTVEQPEIGGTYTEGVIADSPTKVDRVVARLTNIGLTYRDTDGSIQPALAESWTVSADGKVYTFKIKPNYSAAGLMSTIQNTKNDWTSVQISAPDDTTLTFTLPEPLGIFLSSTTQPLFPYGPYEVIKRDKTEVVLRANPQFVLPQPYLQKMVLKLYVSNETLMKAAMDGEIQATADFTGDVPKKFTEYKAPLPRYYVLFFNTTRPVFKKSEDRARVIEKKDGPPVTYSLITSQTGYASELGDQLKSQLAAHNITLDIQKKNSIALQKEELSKRDFDLLLYGIDYGVDRDYYPFWHSSQVTSPGLNLSGTKDKDLDKLLESARREQNATEREKIIGQIEAYLKDKSLQAVLEQETAKFWVSSEIKGVHYATIDESVDRYNLVWRWYSKSRLVKPTS